MIFLKIQMNLIVSSFKITEDLGLWQVLNINKFTKFYALLIFVAQWWKKKGGRLLTALKFPPRSTVLSFEQSKLRTLWRNIPDEAVLFQGQNQTCFLFCAHLHYVYIPARNFSALRAPLAISGKWVPDCFSTSLYLFDWFQCFGVFLFSLFYFRKTAGSYVILRTFLPSQ